MATHTSSGSGRTGGWEAGPVWEAADTVETEVQGKVWFPLPCRRAGVREPGREQLAEAEVYPFPPRPLGGEPPVLPWGPGAFRGHLTAAGGEQGIPGTGPGPGGEG